MYKRTIYVVEGPAGSGKTRLIQALAERGIWTPVEPIIDFERPRAFSGPEGVAYSLVKDHISMTSALMTPRDTIPVIDRWMLSQWVYGEIRRNELFDLAHGYSQAFSAMSSVNSIALELLYRQGKRMADIGSVVVYVHIFVLLPGLDLLKRNREKAGRSFPYDPKTETHKYRGIVNRFGAVPIGVHLDVCGYIIEDESEYPEAYQYFAEIAGEPVS